MKKKDLINEIARKTGCHRNETEKFLDAALETIKETLKKGEPVQLCGFGSFELRDRAPRVGRNIHTGEPVPVAAGKIPAFRPSTSFRKDVQKAEEN